jgi:phosphoesterase RecJ-like protein
VNATEPTVAWETNARIDEIASTLSGASTALILTHAKADGDALGSVLALTRALRSMGKEATAVFLGPWPSRFDGLVGEGEVVKEGEGVFEDPPFAEPDAIAVLDTGSRSQLDEACRYVEARAQKTVIVDHHAHGDAALAHTRHIDTNASAACLIVAKLVSDLLGAPINALPKEIAEPLYLGCATDTGWFKHPNVTPECLRVCADLLEAGADHDALFRTTEQNDPPQRLLLMQRALDSLTLHDERRVAVMSLTARDMESTGASRDDTGGLIDLPKSVGSIRVSVLLTELEGGIVKASFRSKAGENEVDVNLAAQTLGGGGHKHAAGAKVEGTIEGARARVLAALGIDES